MRLDCKLLVGISLLLQHLLLLFHTLPITLVGFPVMFLLFFIGLTCSHLLAFICLIMRQPLVLLQMMPRLQQLLLQKCGIFAHLAASILFWNDIVSTPKCLTTPGTWWQCQIISPALIFTRSGLCVNDNGRHVGMFIRLLPVGVMDGIQWGSCEVMIPLCKLCDRKLQLHNRSILQEWSHSKHNTSGLVGWRSKRIQRTWPTPLGWSDPSSHNNRMNRLPKNEDCLYYNSYKVNLN